MPSYSILIRAAAKWWRIPVTSFELLSLDRFRELLGIEDETTNIHNDFKEIRQ
jgi:hypothetical protein